jgi:hypothetical protein
MHLSPANIRPLPKKTKLNLTGLEMDPAKDGLARERRAAFSCLVGLCSTIVVAAGVVDIQFQYKESSVFFASASKHSVFSVTRLLMQSKYYGQNQAFILGTLWFPCNKFRGRAQAVRQLFTISA